MMSSVQREGFLRVLGHAPTIIGGLLLAMTAAGCGNDGTISVQEQRGEPTIVGVVTGTVFAPNGQIATNDRGWNWLTFFEMSKAYAALNPNVVPVGPEALVALSAVDEIDALDGRIDSPRLIAQGITNVDGQYRIADPDIREIDVCRLMVAVGGGELLTRAFVVASVTDVDVASETTVRIVLNRLTQGPPAQLCDFTTAELVSLLDIVDNATFTAQGDDIFEVNQNAYQTARDDVCVRDAVDKATGNDRDGTPRACLRFYP